MNPSIHHRRSTHRWVAALTVATAIFLFRLPSSSAQTYVCPPPPEGVFGLPGPPKFADPTPDAFSSQLDDPRWNGAWREDFATGSSTEAGVRMLKDGDNLFISLEAKADPNGAAINADNIYIGFSQDGTTGVFVKASLLAGPPLTNSNQVQSAIAYKTTNGGTTWTAVAQGWADSTNVHAWAGTGTGNGDAWAINLKLSLTALGSALGLAPGVALNGPFFMWYEINVLTPTTTVSYDWPPDTTLLFDGGGNPQIALSTFGTAYPTDATKCPTGVSIDAMHIGVKPVVGGIPSTTVHFGTGHAANDFVAELDDGGATLSNDAVKARFRIANWGSTIGVGGDWHDMVPSPGGGVPGTKNNVGNEITFHCVNPPASGDQCYQPPAGAPLDQCLLVELSQANGSGQRFLHDSARRNMDFVNASHFDRSAEISLHDLAPLPGSPGTRDVYLYVRTLNMPEKTDKNPPIDVPPEVPPPNRDQRPSAAGAQAPKGEGPRYRMSTYERYASAMPTYEVHVYHDTGRTRTEKGVTRKILEPQAPFGYFVTHQGDLAGWRHELVGEGFVLDEISPNFFHAKIPDNGTAKVHTTIGTCEHVLFGLLRRCDVGKNRGCSCELGAHGDAAAVPVIVVGAALAIAVRRRRRR